MSRELWHYTCQHGRDQLGDRGTLLPRALQAGSAHREHSPIVLECLVWATDLAEPRAWALGLTSLMLDCNRTAHRYSVDPRAFQRWGRLRSAVDPVLVDHLELAPWAEPAHWWVALGPVPDALYAPVRST